MADEEHRANGGSHKASTAGLYAKTSPGGPLTGVVVCSWPGASVAIVQLAERPGVCCKFGVHEHGLTLLLAWCIELYQQDLASS